MDAATLVKKLSSGGNKASKKGLPKRTGKKHASHLKNLSSQPEKKIRHMIKRNGKKAAKRYAEERNCISIYKRLAGIEG